MRDSTIIYRSFYEAIKELPAQNQAEVWMAIFEYSLNFKEVELSGLSKTIFTLIKPQIQANIKRFKNGSVPKSKGTGGEDEAGNKQKGSKTEAKQKRKKSKSEANNNNNNNGNNNENENNNNNPPFSSAEFLTAWDDYLVSRKQMKKVPTQKAIQLLMIKMREWGEQKSIAALRKSAENGWQGLFEPEFKDIKAPSDGIDYSKLLGYRPDLHGKPGFKFSISPGGGAISYDRI